MPKKTSPSVEWKNCIRFGVCAPCILLLGCVFVFGPTSAQQPGQKTFASAQEAANAFFVASQSADDQALLDILGSTAMDVISSGDRTEDSNARVNFVVKYQQMHRFVTEPDGTVSLVVGAENWPLPIPLVNKNGVWYFDTQASRDEILYRRIGKNELAAIQACIDLADAQRQYYNEPVGGPGKEYAQKLVSDTERHNGLYWKETGNQFVSLINPLVAYASGRIHAMKLVIRYRSMDTSSGSSPAKDLMHRAEQRTISLTER